MSISRLMTTVVLIGLSGQFPGPVQGQDNARVSYLPLPPPVVTIGTEGDPDYEFVRISAALRLPNSELAIADLRTPTIRLFDTKGKLLRKFGRDGAGPGEFRGINALFLAGDTLIAYDWVLRRVTRFLPTGTLLGTQPIQPDATDGPVDLAGRLADGRWLVTTPHNATWAAGHGVYRDTMRVGTLGASGTGAVHWVGMYPGMTFFVYMPGAKKSEWLFGSLPVSATTSAAALGDTIVIGDTGTPDLLFLLGDGRQVQRLTLPLDSPTDLRQHREAARDEALSERGGPAIKNAIQAAFEARRPSPRYRDFLVAANRQVWVRLFENRPTESSRYLVLNPAGAERARVSLPPRSRVLSVQEQWIVVALRDEADVERVGVIRWTTP